jgi:hypothetical protein
VLNSRFFSPVVANKSAPLRRIHTAWLLNTGNTQNCNRVYLCCTSVQTQAKLHPVFYMTLNKL